MEIICTGYLKTGTKSCSSSLRVLGYKVADYVETGEFLSLIWKDFLDEKTDIESVIDLDFIIKMVQKFFSEILSLKS